MASNRKLPFGYEIRQGRIVLKPNEAKTVCRIYQEYASGVSYNKLTEMLQQQGVSYLPEKVWNKNMVARILADKRYLGTEQFPALLDESLYQRVQKISARKAAVPKKSDMTTAIQVLAVCGVCNSAVKRYPNQHGRERWSCSHCKAISPKATDIKLENSVCQIIKKLLGHPGQIKTPVYEASKKEDTVRRQEAAFSQMLYRPDFDEDEAEKQALALAAARFDAIGSEDYETMRIRHILSEAESSDTLDTELLRQITGAVLIHPDGAVSLKLKNGQIIT